MFKGITKRITSFSKIRFVKKMSFVLAVIFSVVSLMPGFSIPTANAATLNLSTVADTYITGGDTNYGAGGTVSCRSTLRVPYFKFDLNSLVGTVTSAKLNIYVTPTFTAPVTSSALKVYPVNDDSWIEGNGSSGGTTITTGALTYNNRKTLGTQLTTSSSIAGAGWVEIDLTSYILQEAAGNKIASIAMQGGDGSTVFTIHTKETTTSVSGVSCKPFLKVEYSDTNAPTWTSGTMNTSNITKNSVDLSWSGASDNIGVTGYKIFKNSDVNPVAIVTSGTSYSVTGLNSSTSYTFKVEAIDAADNVSTTGPRILQQE